MSNISQYSQGFDLNDSAQRNQYITALNLLSNADEYDINLLFLPGIIDNFSNHQSIVSKAINKWSTTSLWPITDLEIIL